jgi:hypothetical protein
MPAVERTLHRTVVRVVWPLQPTVVDAREFPETAAVVVKLFAGAATTIQDQGDVQRLAVRTAVGRP